MISNHDETRLRVSALVVSGMGMMELAVLTVFERSAFLLLFDENADVSDGDVLQVFNALRLVVDVLPLALGIFIAGTLGLGVLVALKSKWSRLPNLALALFLAMLFYNVVITDTAGIVDTLKSTSDQSSMADIRSATQGVLRQHHVGLLGFAAFFMCQIVLVAQALSTHDSAHDAPTKT